MNGPVTPSRSIFISMFNPDVSVECPLVHHPVGKRVLGGTKALPMHCPQIGNKGQAGALGPTKGSLKGRGQEEVLVSGCLRLAGHHLLNTVPLSQVVDGIEVYGTKVHCKVTSRFAHNVVTTRAVNHADTFRHFRSQQTSSSPRASVRWMLKPHSSPMTS